MVKFNPAQDVSKDKAIKGAKTKKRKRKGSEKVEETTGAGDEGNEKKTKRLAPNFFVAVQVSNPQVWPNHSQKSAYSN